MKKSTMNISAPIAKMRGREGEHPVIFLMGATACGKTELAAALFEQYHAELVSVDAAQVYRGMDIGTAKPQQEFLRNYPHHLIDICAAHENYCAARFREDALALIGRIHAAGKLPILVGGSMFYFAALENGLSELPSADEESRLHITDEIRRYGLAEMYARLCKIDPKIATKIRPSDTQRIQRALEIHLLSARPPSEVMAQSAPQPLPFPLIKLGLFCAERKVLHTRIAARFLQMLENGLVDEVKAVLSTIPEGHNAPSLRTVGYRQVLAFLRGEIDYDEMCQLAIAATRQLAKRQLTWMRQQQNLVWIDAQASPQAVLRDYLAQCLR